MLTPIPASSHHVRCFSSRSHGSAVELVLSEPGAFPSYPARRFRRARPLRQFRVRSCLLVRSHAACEHAAAPAVCDHPHVRAQVRDAHAHSLADDPREHRSQSLARKTRTGRKTEFQVRAHRTRSKCTKRRSENMSQFFSGPSCGTRYAHVRPRLRGGP